MSDRDKASTLRKNAAFNLLFNPNYFGSYKEMMSSDTNKSIFDFPAAVLDLTGNTDYEEMDCLGYDPDRAELTAMVKVKQGGGYSGGPCTDGSWEYVRFYIDYGAGWVDAGVAGFNAHDLDLSDDLCYAVSLTLTPELRSFCRDAPVLPLVRAILSWNIVPPASAPLWLPVWGNRIDRHIQIKPRRRLPWPLDVILETKAKLDPSDLAILSEALEPLPLPEPPVPDFAEMIERARKYDVPLHRVTYPLVHQLLSAKLSLATSNIAGLLIENTPKFTDFLENPKFDTSYEELCCVGLDRARSVLHGIVEIKRPFGYSGGLCTTGSTEYIAFYLDFGMGWQYMGTTSVAVHDIPEIPRGGLWYQAALPVDLTPWQRAWCDTGRARLRGILSWSVPPVPNSPEHIPHWGDREDCYIEVKPRRRLVPEGLTPFIEAIGSMALDDIDNASGLASGPNIFGTLTANLSPFGGTITIAGLIANTGGQPLEYRVMVRAPSDPSPQPWTKKFNVTVTSFPGGIISHPLQTPDAQGWMPYLHSPSSFVAGNLLIPFTATEEGLHLVHVEVRHAVTHIPLAATAVERFFVDNSAPVVDIAITSGPGNCGKFKIGAVIGGTWSMSDAHSGSLSLSTSPFAGPVRILTPVLSASASLAYPVTLPTGGSAGMWELDTTGMTPCGYNIWIGANDRTIVNSGAVGWHASKPVGFCLE